MNNVTIEYEVTREGEVVIHNFATVGITDKNVKEINEFITSDPEHATCELIDIPGHVYDRIFNGVVDDAINKTKRRGGILDTDTFNLQMYLPDEIINLLPEETIAMFPEGLIQTEEESEPDDQFDMNVESYHVDKVRGIIYIGTMNYGYCEIGNDCLLLNQDGEVVAESKIIAIEYNNKLNADTKGIMNIDGAELGLMTRANDPELAEQVYAIVVPKPEV